MGANPDLDLDAVAPDVRAWIESIDSQEWDHVAASERVAELLVEHGYAALAAARLRDSARSCELAAQVERSARLWERIAAIDGLDDEAVDEALVGAARAYGSIPDGQAKRAALLDRMWQLAHAAADEHRMARALYLRYLAAEGDGAEDARALLRDGAALPDTCGWAWQCRSLDASLDDDPPTAVAASRAALVIARATGDLLLELRALEGIGWYEAFEGDARTSIDVLAAAVELARRVGDLDAVLQGQSNLAHAHLHQLDADASWSCIDRLERDVPEELAPAWARQVAALRANVLRFRGRYLDALEAGRRAAEADGTDDAYRARDAVVVQAWLDAAADAGRLDDARAALARLEAIAAASGDVVVERDAEWGRLRLRAADGGAIDESWLGRLAAVLDGADEWLEGCVAADGARLGVWRGDPRVLDVIVDRLGTVEAAPLVELRRDEARALRALVVDGDPRPARGVQHRMDRAGAASDAARMQLFEAAATERSMELDRKALQAFRDLEAAGAERDLLDALVAMPWLASAAGAWIPQVVAPEALDRCGRELEEAGTRIEIPAGDARELPSRPFVVLDGVACLRDDQDGCVGVAGRLGVVDIDAARSDGATSVQATRACVLLVAPPSLDGIRWWRPDRGHVRLVLDTRVDAQARLATAIESLIARWGDDHGPIRRFDCGLSQSDLASLVGASRKTATLAIAQLRRDGRLEARRGVLERRAD